MRSIVFIFLSGCVGEIPINKDPNTLAINNTDSSYKELKKETLDKACNDQMRSFYEREIERQSRHLTSEQLKKSISNMKKDIKCN